MDTVLYKFIAVNYAILSKTSNLPSEWEAIIKLIRRRESIYATYKTLLGHVGIGNLDGHINFKVNVPNMGDVHTVIGDTVECYLNNVRLQFPLVARFADGAAGHNCFYVTDRVHELYNAESDIACKSITGLFKQYKGGSLKYSITDVVVHGAHNLTVNSYNEQPGLLN